jgi:hypothetical protein
MEEGTIRESAGNTLPSVVSRRDFSKEGLRRGDDGHRLSLEKRIQIFGLIPFASTTTVVMKAHESWDESGACAHIVENGFDGPRTASSCETVTRRASARANARGRAGQWPTSDALPAPSTRQAHRFRNFFFLLSHPHAGEPGMGHHRQGDVAVPTVPEAYLILIQPRLALGFLNALLNRVAA